MPSCDPTPYHKFDKSAQAPEKKDENKKIENLRAELAALGKTYNDLHETADKLTQLLCYACGTLVDRHIMPELDERLMKWWNEHVEWDFNRTLQTMKKMYGENKVYEGDARRYFIEIAEAKHPLSNYHRGEYFNRVYDAFIDWQKNTRNRAKRIAELEAELAKLKAEM